MTLSRTRGASLLLGSILLLAAAAAPRAADERPFRADLQGNANPMPTADPCIFVNNESGTGHARHLGAVTWVSSETVDFCAGPAGAAVRGTSVMTAANGDQLILKYETTAAPDPVTARITFAGTWQAIGGTGRFESATGTGALSGSGSLLPPFELSATFDGALLY